MTTPDTARLREIAADANVAVIREMLESEAENRSAAGSDMSDYADEPQQALDALDALVADRAALEAENAELKADVVAFCSVWAVPYAQNGGLPPGHLHPQHYDILARCGARMDDFVRADLHQEKNDA